MESIFNQDQISFYSNYSLPLETLVNSYCVWDTMLRDYWGCQAYPWTNEISTNHCPFKYGDDIEYEQYHYVSNSSLNQSNQLCEGAESAKPSLHKRLLVQTHDFSQNIQRLLAAVKGSIDEDKIIVNAKKKSEAKVCRSNRRSRFTGVFRNGDNWQSFISIEKRKTYLGTYDTQEEAAEVFDFYSLLLNWLVAKTNFDYSKKDIENMINKFVCKDNMCC